MEFLSTTLQAEVSVTNYISNYTLVHSRELFQNKSLLSLVMTSMVGSSLEQWNMKKITHLLMYYAAAKKCSTLESLFFCDHLMIHVFTFFTIFFSALYKIYEFFYDKKRT